VQVEDQWAVHCTQPKCAVSSTTMPKTMRYQAKGVKSWLEISAAASDAQQSGNEGRNETDHPHADIVGTEQRRSL
jgi:hypothetical protein